MPPQDIRRLLLISVENKHFCARLLNPATREKALDYGFRGERFQFDEDERQRILGAPSSSLLEFARAINDGKEVPGKER